MVHVVLDQRSLRCAERLLHRVQLLRDLEARTLPLDHGDDGPQMPFGAPQALDDFRMGLVKNALAHELILSPWIGYVNRWCQRGCDERRKRGGAGAAAEKSRIAGAVSEDLLKEFRGLDSDGDGFLGRSELSSKRELAEAFDKDDKDGNDKLDPAEYQLLRTEVSLSG